MSPTIGLSMLSDKRRGLPPGRQPYDAVNGLRVGALAGAVLAGFVVATTSFDFIWLMLVGLIVGGAIGFWFERHRSG